ncbi:MAG: hypothetical protein L6Q99_21760 [Planctomycetes bacterium]|nr:hypothetical protein [Planctomycetota bacterium]
MAHLPSIATLGLVLFQAQDPTSQPLLDVAQLALDELITRLPLVHEECDWDSKRNVATCDPALMEFLRRLQSGARPSDEQWREVLVRTGCLRYRDRWPVDRPFAVSMRMPVWLPFSTIELVPTDATLAPAAARSLPPGGCGTYADWVASDALYQELGRLPAGLQHLEFRASIVVDGVMAGGFANRFPLPSLPEGVLWSGALTLTTEIVPTIDDAVSPIDDAAIGAAVRAALGVAFSTWRIEGEWQRTAIVVLDPDVRANPVLDGVALSTRVEVVHDGAIVDTLELVASDHDRVALANSTSSSGRRRIDFASSRRIPAASETDPAARVGRTLRVVGTSEHVHALWGASRRWSGLLEIPLDEAIRNEVQRVSPKARRSWVWSSSRR